MTEEHRKYETEGAGAAGELLKGSPALLPYSDSRYRPPTSEEIIAAIELAGLSSAEVGNLLGTDGRSIRRYKAGRDMPYAAWRLLLIETGLVHGKSTAG